MGIREARQQLRGSAHVPGPADDYLVCIRISLATPCHSKSEQLICKSCAQSMRPRSAQPCHLRARHSTRHRSAQHPPVHNAAYVRDRVLDHAAACMCV